ncbi:MAG: hypothetical protein GMKNLPBB_01353 [Myxococcota bacterium]|nr:hypothetical protein [Myxococcota bacterium]
MKWSLFPVLVLAIVAWTAACEDKNLSSNPAPGGAPPVVIPPSAPALPPGHPPIDGPRGGAAAPPSVHAPVAPRQRVVKVDPAIIAQYKTARIEVSSKTGEAPSMTEIPVAGGEGKLPDGSVVRLLAFTPDFIMDGDVISTKGKELGNAGVQVEINGARLWIFKDFVMPPSYSHPKYNFRLAGVEK